MHWADEAAQRIVQRHEGPYTVASGITPSGTIHLGNFREVYTTHLVARVLRGLGHEVTHIHFWDDFDLRRGTNEILADTWSGMGDMHYFVNELERIGCVPDRYIYQSEMYRQGNYADYIDAAVSNEGSIRHHLNRYRSEPLPEEWSPLMEHGKLVWRVDWPMRWACYDIDFEPGGKDHSVESGSYETSVEICRRIFNQEPPEYLQYDFVQVNGSGKMSSSSGDVITITDALEVYRPEVLRWIFAKNRANREFNIDLNQDVADNLTRQFERSATGSEVQRRAYALAI